MQQEKQTSFIGIQEIAYQAQTIKKLDQLQIKRLSRYQEDFRLSCRSLEQQVTKKNDPNQSQLFHMNIVNLIGKIQPSKSILAIVLDEVENLLSSFYPQDANFQLRNAAKSKNIFVIDKLTPNQERQLFVDVKTSINNTKRCLLLRESQLHMVIYIEENVKKYPSHEFMNRYEKYFEEIKQYVIPSKECFRPINYYLLSKILEIQTSYYEQFGSKASILEDEVFQCSKLLQKQETIKSTSKQSIEKSIKLLKILSSKIFSIADLFPFACVKDHQDLFSKEKSHHRWKRLFDLDVITYKLYGQATTVDKSFDKLKANLNIINATMNILNQNNAIQGSQNFSKKLQSASKVLQVALFKDNALHEAEVMISEPNEKLAKEIWNLPQRAQFKKLIELGLPSIEFSQQFYIPRITSDFFYSKLKDDQAWLPCFKIQNFTKYCQELRIQSNQKVPIRINNHFKLVLKQTQEEKFESQTNLFKKAFKDLSKNVKSNMQNLKSKFKAINENPKEVIFHIHGGGFISMSSFIHQAYTRKWANNLKVPIISVDYGKAPQHPYPEGLADCFEAYCWTVSCMRQIYQFQPVKIILVGDSAGGNLVAALTNLIIKWGLRMPDGIVLVYPALNLNYYDYSPSLLTALNDLILPHTFLKICLKSYLKDPNLRPDKDYIVSPIHAPQQILKKYPKTRIFVGSKDPFHDDCCRFAQKLSLIDPGRVHLTIIQQFPHGFLQFDMKNQPHYYCNQATKQVEQALKYLLIPKPIQV